MNSPYNTVTSNLSRSRSAREVNDINRRSKISRCNTITTANNMYDKRRNNSRKINNNMVNMTSTDKQTTAPFLEEEIKLQNLVQIYLCITST